MGRVWVRRGLAVTVAAVVGMGLAGPATGLASGSGGSAGGDDGGPAGTDSGALRASGLKVGSANKLAFDANQAYANDFPDPSVMRVGSRYYAYSTTIANKNLPMMTSSDLLTWTARPSYSANPNDNDALPDSAVWSQWSGTKTPGHRVSTTWAPSVAIVSGRYVEAYATPVAGQTKFCVSVARSTSALGPFVDNTTAPLVCPAGQGAIDPYIFKWKHKYWLLWKTEGRPGVPSKIWSRQLNKYATGFARKSRAKAILKPEYSWEGSVIENPAMIVWKKRLYLFYSANSWSSDRYRIGYALCTGVQGTCKRLTRYPFMGNTSTISGPGGNSPFLDTKGHLRLAYHSWTPGQVGYSTAPSCRKADPGACPQRRLHVALLTRVPGTKRLKVVNAGARVAE